MPKDKVLKIILIVSLAMAIVFPVLNIYYIYPMFTNFLIENSEEEADRTANYLHYMLQLLGTDLDKNSLPNHFIDKIKNLQNHFKFTKMKIISKSGEVIYSTDPNDTENVNEKSYFHEIVAKGEKYSEVVKRNTMTANDPDSESSVVEIYVPMIEDNKFFGAFEIYYDITERTRKFGNIISISSLTPFVVMLIFLIMSLMGIYTLDRSIINRNHAEESLKKFARKLEQSNQELQDFAHIASHDLQEPLRKVIFFGERLKTKYAENLGDQGRDYLERMQSASKRMQNLINGLLLFSRVKTKAMPFQTVNLEKTVNEVLSDLEVRIQDVNARVEISHLDIIDADPLQVRQLFQNIIGNALKFHKKGEAPVVKVSGAVIDNGKKRSGRNNSEHAFYQIVFEDNGIGFDQKYADRIFGAFNRLHGRKEYEGTGIGLSVCQKIVERHGGSIKAESSPGNGTTFTVTLPLSQHNDEKDKNMKIRAG